MLIARLQVLVDNLAKLPAEHQERLAAHLEEALADALDEADWDALFNDPRADVFLARLRAEAQAGASLPLPHEPRPPAQR